MKELQWSPPYKNVIEQDHFEQWHYKTLTLFLIQNKKKEKTEETKSLVIKS